MVEFDDLKMRSNISDRVSPLSLKRALLTFDQTEPSSADAGAGETLIGHTFTSSKKKEKVHQQVMAKASLVVLQLGAHIAALLLFG